MIHLTMKSNTCVGQQKQVGPVTNFIKATKNGNFPANIFVIFNTHSDANTGCLQHVGGVTSAVVAPVDEVSFFSPL